MKIKKIKWSGRAQDVTHIGEKTGTKFVCDEVEVSEFGYDKAQEITEDSLTVYSIHYRDGRILRVFNPIEVLFVP